jgi:hypothetical protein
MVSSGSPTARAALLQGKLSPDRLAPYVRACAGDLDAAVSLYEHNTALSGTFFQSLSCLEVILRNALHDQLTAWHDARSRPGQWYHDPAHLLEGRARQDIAIARDRLRQRHKTETPGRIVAELSFGFWRFLIGKRYQATLWPQALRFAFPYLQPKPVRSRVSDPVDSLHRLRNRIAHHERIHHERLADRYRDLLLVAGLIHPEALAWINDTSRVPGLLTAAVSVHGQCPAGPP